MRLYILLAMRSLRARPLRMLLSGFGIMLGVAAFLAISVTNRIALDSVIRLFQDTAGKANLTVTSSVSDGRGFNDTLLETFRHEPEIILAVPSMNLTAQLQKQARTSDITINFFGLGDGGLMLQGIDPQLDPQLHTYSMVEGDFFSDPSADEIVLVQDYARDNKLQVGKNVEILLPTGPKDLKLVGLIAKEGPGQQNNGAFGVIPLTTAQKLNDRPGRLDQIDLVINANLTSPAALDSMRTKLQQSLGEKFVVIYPAVQGQRMTQMLSNYQIGLNFLSGMSLFVGAFLIFNAFSMTVVERTAEFGMLRTVGMSRRQVTTLVLGEALLLGLIGSLLGLFAGVALSKGLSQMMGVMLAQNLEVARNIPHSIALTGLLIGVGVSLLAAGLPARQAGRISPLEAIHVRSQTRPSWILRFGWISGLLLLLICAVILVINPFPYDVQFRIGTLVVFALFLGGVLIIPATLGLWQRLLRPLIRLAFGRSGQLGGANVNRSLQRTTLTVSALLIGVAMIVVVWTMTDSFKRDLDEWLNGFVGGDLYITSSLPMGRDVWRRLENTSGVVAVAPVRYFEIQWLPPGGKQESILFMGLDPASYSHVSSFIFMSAKPDPVGALNRLAQGESIFVSSVIAERYGIHPGDQITLMAHTHAHTFNVAAVVVDYYNQGMVVKGSWQDMNRYFRQDEASSFLVKVQPGQDPNQVSATIHNLFGKRDRLEIYTNQALRLRINVLMQQAFSLFNVLALISMVVGFFGITNTLTMNVLERTRELGMLRAIGMTRSQVLRMVLAEAGFMGVVGGVMGILFGIILARIFMLAMTAMSGYRLAFVFPAQKALMAIAIGLLTALAAALMPALRATRIRILEAVHYE